MALWKDLVICGISPVNTDPSAPINDPHHLCQFADFIVLANNVIQDLIIAATVLTVFVFIWAGFKLVTATFTGNSGALSEARKVFFNVLKGYVLILAAWTIVYTILHALVDPKYWLLG